MSIILLLQNIPLQSTMTITQDSEPIPPTSAAEKTALTPQTTECTTQGATEFLPRSNHVQAEAEAEEEGGKVDLRQLKEQQRQQSPLPPPPPMVMASVASTESDKSETEMSIHKLSPTPLLHEPVTVTPAQEMNQIQALPLEEHFENTKTKTASLNQHFVFTFTAPTVSIRESDGSELETSGDEDDVSIFSLDDYDTFQMKPTKKKKKNGAPSSSSSQRKKRAAVASLKNDDANTTERQSKKPRASVNQQYCVGTTISKKFLVPGQQKLQSFRGEVTEYYPDDQLYHIVFEDGDSEDMDEGEVAMYLVAAPKNDDDNQEDANVDFKKTAKTVVTDDDVNPKKHLTVGDVVYAALWKTKKRDQSYTMFRGTVEAMKQDRWSHSYDIAFDNGQYLESIDKSLVISEHRYLHENLKQRLEVGERVVAAWWEDALDNSSPPAGWYPGVVKACRQLQQGGKFGPDRFYDIKFDDGDELDDIEDIFVFQEREYELLSREATDEISGWKGVRNVLDKGSTDRWARTVGYWELQDKRGGNERPFSFLGDALRCYDDHIVSCRGASIKKADLNLPEEWVIDPEAKSPPVRSLVRSVNNDTGRPVAQISRDDTSNGKPQSDQVSCEGYHVAKSQVKIDAKSLSFQEQKARLIREAGDVDDDDKKRKGQPKAPVHAPASPIHAYKDSTDRGTNNSTRLASAVALRQRRSSLRPSSSDGTSSLASTDRRRMIKIVEYVQPAKPSFEQNEGAQVGTEDGNEPQNSSSTCNKRIKPIINRGERVYAVLRAKGGDASSSTHTNWLPGRVWDFKVKHESSYGPVKTYDIIFDNGEIETYLDEIWVMKKDDYDILSDLPDESVWIGVVHYTDPSSNDDYAKTVGWYDTYCDGDHRFFTSIGDALRAHDKYIISQRSRDNVSDKELNFPQE